MYAEMAKHRCHKDLLHIPHALSIADSGVKVARGTVTRERSMAWHTESSACKQLCTYMPGLSCPSVAGSAQAPKLVLTLMPIISSICSELACFLAASSAALTESGNVSVYNTHASI